MCVCVCARNALDSMAGQHKVDLQQARQQAVDEYRARAVQCEQQPAADVSDTSLLTESHDANAVSYHTVHYACKAFSALMLLVRQQEEHLACNKMSDELLAWLSVWNAVQMTCLWSS